MRLLLVEDDREISRMLEGYLANENFDVVWTGRRPYGGLTAALIWCCLI